MEMANYVHGLVVYLMSTLNSFRAEESKLQDYRFIVGLGDISVSKIACLGAVVKLDTVLTLASCLDDQNAVDNLKASDDPNVEDSTIQDDASRGADSANKVAERVKRHWKLVTKSHTTLRAKIHGVLMGTRLKREGDEAEEIAEHGDEESEEAAEHGDEEVSREHYGYENETAYNQEPKEYDYYDYEGEGSTIRATLFRIDPEKKIFMQLTADVVYISKPTDYEARNFIKLWKHNAAFAFMHPKYLDHRKVHPIPLAILKFGDYIKSLHQDMVNSMDCQVIGLVQYSDNGPYTPRDTDVELVAHSVLVDYSKCNQSKCIEDESLCAGTGHHIYKNPRSPMPDFLRGASLVCKGQLLSIIDTTSKCDEQLYSAEFPSPEIIHILISMFEDSIFKENKRSGSVVKMDIPVIPYPKWYISGASAVLNTLHVTSPLIWLGNRIMRKV